MGNDFQTFTTSSDNAAILAVADGIKSVDPHHLMTVELNYFESGSLDSPAWASRVGLDAAYSYPTVFSRELQEHNRSSVPVFLVEGNYEFENNTGNDQGTPEVLRRQLWWTTTSGSDGQIYGNLYSVRFLSGWQSNLDTPGAAQQHLATTFLNQFRWYDLVPDQNHTLVTAGFGNCAKSPVEHTSNCATSALTADGTLGLVYAPTNATLTINMAKFAGPVTGTWFDPSNGATSAAGVLAANGVQSLTTPGNDADSNTDWVLLLQANAGAPTATPTSVTPTNTAMPTATLTHCRPVSRCQ